MFLHIIACQVFYRELCYLAALSGSTSTVTWMPQGLHDTPDRLRAAVSAEIARVETGIREGSFKHNPDRIVLGYGLCSNGIVGLESGSLPIVVPRADDCIGVFLGSQQRYLELFGRHPGTYWLNGGWLESAFLPTRKNYAAMRQDYADRYGEDNADFLMENEVGWIKNYQNCGYIRSQVYDNTGFERQAQEIAAECGWEKLAFDGSNRLLRLVMDGECPEEEFLFCPPYHRITATYDERKIAAVAIG